MKGSWITACSAGLVLCLSGCGGGSGSATTTSSPSASSTASPSASATPVSKVVPNVVGKPATDARALMNNVPLNSTLVGPDGVAWTHGPSNSAKVVSTDPPAGATTTNGTVKLFLDMKQADAEAAEVKASADAKLANRYTISCGSDSSKPKFKSYKDVWSSPEFGSSGKCAVQIDGRYPSIGALDNPIALLPSEQAIVNIVGPNGSSGHPAETFANVMALCATVPKDFPDTIIGPSGAAMKQRIQGALALCPDAPHAALLQQALTVVKYDSGRSYTVGKDMEPGTYGTRPGVKDCYWSRTTGGGDIIANDFIEYAPNGVTVTVYAGEGFTANDCGVWTKVG
jgi:hypothetical protein